MLRTVSQEPYPRRVLDAVPGQNRILFNGTIRTVSSQPDGFDRAIAVTRTAHDASTGTDTYTAELNGDFGVGDIVNGGYLTAVVLRAALHDAPHPHPVACATNFLRVGRAGPARIDVQQVKAGRTTVVRRATLSQAGEPVVATTVTAATLDAAARPDWQAPGRLPLPPVADCVAPPPEFGGAGFGRHVELLFDPACTGWVDGTPSGTLAMRAYVRLRERRDPDAYLLALAVDALPPAPFELGRIGWAPTVELTWHMRAVPAPGRLAVAVDGHLMHDGWFDEDARVYDSTGRLVAQGRQLARAAR